MKNLKDLIPRTPPEGLTQWKPVRDALKTGGMVYEAVRVPNIGLEQPLDKYADVGKIKKVSVRCSSCQEEMLLPWAKTQPDRGGYGFLNPNEDFNVVGSGDETVCPICGARVKVKKDAELKKKGYFVADETDAVSAAVIGKERYLVLTQWVIQDRVYRSGNLRTEFLPVESYVFGSRDCWKLTGWVNSYSGTCGYFPVYLHEWRMGRDWSETMGAVDQIYGLTSDLIGTSCLANCKLDVYMSTFSSEKRKFPIAYMRLYQAHPNLENLLLNGLPMVLDDLLAEKVESLDWKNNRKGLPALAEIRWSKNRPAQMLGLTKEELRTGVRQCWGAFLWRLFVRAKHYGERLTEEDIRNAWTLGDVNSLNLSGVAPVGKSLRYLLQQIELATTITGEYNEDGEPVLEDTIDTTMLLDYWRACRAIGRDLEDSQVRWPRDLIAAHDEAVERSRWIDSAENAKKLASKFRIRRRQLARYIFEANGLKIVPAYSQLELQREADLLHHCVWTYAERHAEGRTAIFFIRRKAEPGKPYYTLELDEQTLLVRQNRGLRNCGKTPEVQAFEDLWISWVRAGAMRDKNGWPVLLEKQVDARGA